MTLKLTDCSLQKFMEFATERNEKWKNDKYNLSYMTEARLQKVFEYMCKRKLKCSGNSCCLSDIDGFISKFSQPQEKPETLMEECLFHEVWCRCEWIYRIIDTDRDFHEFLKPYIGSKNVKMFESVV